MRAVSIALLNHPGRRVFEGRVETGPERPA
jgi:hypothetical protein